MIEAATEIEAANGVASAGGVAASDGIVRLGGWTPEALYGDGEDGVWLSAADLSTVYQDAGRSVGAGVGDVVGGLTNKSGKGYHAAQATAAARPILRQSGGLYYLELDGADDFLRVVFGVTLTGEHTVAVAAAKTGGGNYLFDGDDATHRNTLFISGGVSNYFAGSTVGGVGASDSAAHVWRALYSGADSSGHRDGSVDATGNFGGQFADALTLGARYDGTGALGGRIYEVVSVNRRLTAAEATLLDAYMALKGGVAL